jgi:hypothetical protein
MTKVLKIEFLGVYIWAEGARYEGEYKEHKKHGRGLQTWPTGGRYDKSFDCASGRVYSVLYIVRSVGAVELDFKFCRFWLLNLACT